MRPLASINFVTCHDGFTLRDLVSYNDKHNEANGEDNRDGESHNRSWNCGAEGETNDPAVRELRARQMRNFIATLMLSQGVPMISHGDEVARTQGGNNNAYCQDSEIAWVTWPESAEAAGLGSELLDFTRAMVWLRKDHPVFRRRRFFHGRPVEGTHDELSDIAWFTPEGKEMTQRDWDRAQASALTVFLNGNAISEPGARGERITDDSFLLMFNASPKTLDFVVPVNHGRAVAGRGRHRPPGRGTAGHGGEGAGRGPADPGGPEHDGAPAAGLGGRTRTHMEHAMTRKAAGRVRRFA